jgi:hypothetical protein
MKKHPARRAAELDARIAATQNRPDSNQHKTTPQLISWEEVIGER